MASAEKIIVSERLVTTCSIQRNNVTISVSATCGSWELSQKFINDFQKKIMEK
ncbi:MAG: hypothetical protein PHH61_06385 [Candidatus Nanoarchaeia archaeon]|nr:hypothetical protein [Candidatus Nanoarchaeia archaeon]